MKRVATAGTIVVALLLAVVSAAASEPGGQLFIAPSGSCRTSWVGNSFGGDGGANGFGYWVQNGAAKIAVAPDGTVIAGTDWDEAGRCAGLYKDGKCNRVLLKKERGAESAWGWSTGNHAVAVNGGHIFVANTGKRLLRFSWKPGELDSAQFADEVEMPDKAVALNSRGGVLAVGYARRIELRRSSDMGAISGFALNDDVRDLVIAPDQSLWIVAGASILHLKMDGSSAGAAISTVARPTAVAFDNQDRLVICDDGPDQQVKFFDVSGTPTQVATFGDRGGMLAGTPGIAAPLKLFSPRGAGTDKDGNLYIAMGFGGAPVGNLVLRSFTPRGALRWELSSLAFVDTFGFDPDSDGSVIYSRTAAFDLDLTRAKSGSEWSLKAITLDHVNHPEDPRLTAGMTTYMRRLQGRRVLYTIGQYAGGYNIYTFDEPGGYSAREVDRIRAKKQDGEQWAWDVALNGDIWQGDAPQRKIRRYPFGGWTADNKPRYDWGNPQTWPCPQDFENVRRIIYRPEGDTLYLFGYLKGQKIDSWGVVGFTCRRYDGWLGGKPQVTWTNQSLPINSKGADDGGPLSASGVCIAGDYLFIGMVKPDDGRQYVHILNLADGSYAGSFKPGDAVGGNAGWEDMPYSVQAIKRKNGEYLILVEEDWRGKNLLYRWTPEAKP
jgi:hypothetical protein